MSMLFSDTLRSGGLRSRMSQQAMLRLAGRYSKFRVPPTSEKLFGEIGDRYFRRFGRKLPAVETRQYPQPSPFIPQWTPTDQQRAASMKGPPLLRGLVDPTAIGGAGAMPQLEATGDAATTFNYRADFKPEWVDDRDWNVRKLPELVGSGMLSQAQLQNLSISNIMTMFDFRGGSEQERLEMGFLLQRFMMEGYVRGVDVHKFIQDTNRADGARIIIGLMTEDEMKKLYNPGGAAALAAPGGAHQILQGWSPNANYVLFTDGYWRDSPDVEKFGMFFHEMGHQLGLPHAGDQGWNPTGAYSFMGSGPGAEPLPNHPHFDVNAYMPWFNNHGQQLISQLFADAGRGPGHTTMGAPLARSGPVHDLNYLVPANQTLPTNPPGGFPQIGGTDWNNVPTPPQIIHTERERNVYNVRPTNVAPASPTPSLSLDEGMVDASTPEGVDKTPVAGMLPQLPELKSFASGLDDIMTRAAPMLGNLAGSILRRKGA